MGYGHHIQTNHLRKFGVEAEFGQLASHLDQESVVRDQGSAKEILDQLIALDRRVWPNDVTANRGEVSANRGEVSRKKRTPQIPHGIFFCQLDFNQLPARADFAFHNRLQPQALHQTANRVL